MTLPSGNRAPSRVVVVVKGVVPEVDGGVFAVKRCVGEKLNGRARVFTDGHDLVACALVRAAGDSG